MTQKNVPSPLRLGVAGLGTVGLSLLKLLSEHKTSLRRKLGRDITITAVSARHKTPQRERYIPRTATWHDDARALAQDDNVDVVVELIGGSEGIAKDLIYSALKNKKAVVTGNKALIANDGEALEKLSQENGVPLLYEAAVAGGIPAIKSTREALIGDSITAIGGILNGTSNFVLTNMLMKGQDFDTVLSEAQSLGYAEADPTADVDGYDAAHKLAILTHLAFGYPFNFSSIDMTGMRDITMLDHLLADQLGYRIKLLGYAHCLDNQISNFVAPCLIPKSDPLARVDGVTNAVKIQGSAIGSLFLEGPGAGGDPTALAVIADIADIACGVKPFPAFDEKQNPPKVISEEHPFYVRIPIAGNAENWARILEHFARHNIAIDTLLQRPEHIPAGKFPFALVTKQTSPKTLKKLLADLDKAFPSQKKAFMMRVMAS